MVYIKEMRRHIKKILLIKFSLRSLCRMIYSRPYWEPLVHVERENESCVSGTGLTGYDYRLVEQAIKA